MISRRPLFGLLASSVLAKAFGESGSRAPCYGAMRSEVERLADAYPSAALRYKAAVSYSASATVTLFSIPIVSRGGVGSGYAAIEEGTCGRATVSSIQFGAGSWPEAARGLNRFGSIREFVVEQNAGEAEQCAYFAFMTASPEKDVTQARQALETTAASLPCTAAQGKGDRGGFASRVEALDLPASLTWRDAGKLAARVQTAIGRAPCLDASDPAASGRAGAATFLYSLRRSLLDPAEETRRTLFFNNKQYLLDARKDRDPEAGARLAQRGVAADASSVMRLSATLTNRATGRVTPFRVWYCREKPEAAPLRFEYQAKPFLRLNFEVDPAAPPPPVGFALKEKRT